MPAERAKQTKSDDTDRAQLTWAVPVEPASQSIAFAPNITPGTFTDPPLAIEAVFEPILFPSSPSESSVRRPAHSKKRAEDHIPRPPNAFILFRSSFIKSQHVSTDVETNHSTLSKIIGLTWQNMPHDERQIWHAKAKKALEEHRKKWPQYAFRPSHGKTKGAAEKRKVREVEPKDMKRCAKIAELLVEGKKGADLDAAIQEFDRTHVPEVVTRFEAPVTASSYRRSSSAPIDVAQSKQFFPCPSTPRRTRSTSTRPASKHVEQAQPAPLAASHSCPDFSSIQSFVPCHEYSFPHKSQPSFELDPFMFDVAFGDSISSTSADISGYPSTPTHRVHTPTLCFDSAYGSDWTPVSSPFSSSPTTPQALLPSPAFDCMLDSEDPFALNPFSLAPTQLQQCGQQYTAGLNNFVHGNAGDDPLFAQFNLAPFSKEQFSFDCPEKPLLGTVDTDFSAFMTSLSAF
ncbi:hypothetical protein PAXRUDRAFT_825171 [Paxillus rubicundulus Ve08.2h10]|uniref:HMG box domain-containing protein n=1 Tax=Paxillus rubicundulus Ve08.2h10 TaxID=930991 RepID=A0A0D0DGQ4_9AGAM|nr:hypothetical protein PAXRUDRAFT_825171 [Paxillus rubicundulus Ve08.2h10]